MINFYWCPHCKKLNKRDSAKRTIKSVCLATEKDAKMLKVVGSKAVRKLLNVIFRANLQIAKKDLDFTTKVG